MIECNKSERIINFYIMKKEKTKEEKLWNYLIKRCDTDYEARLMYNRIIKIMA